MFNRLGFMVLCLGLPFGGAAEAASTKRLSDAVFVALVSRVGPTRAKLFFLKVKQMKSLV